MIDTCQDKKDSPPSFIILIWKEVFIAIISRPLIEAGSLKRRLIILIFAGWLPHFISSPRSCLCLNSGVRLSAISHSWIEGSPWPWSRPYRWPGSIL